MHKLSKRDARQLLELLSRSLGVGLEEEEVTVMEEGGIKLYRIGGMVFAEYGPSFLPVVDEAVNGAVLNSLPSIVVDMGAVARIADGADVMRPGVTEVVGDFGQGQLVVVRDERHRKPLAVCKSLVSSDEMRRLMKGRVAVNLHHVGDRIWKLSRELLARTT